jgi:hypothetical protein
MIEEVVIFGSATRGLVLQEVAKASQPVSAFAISKVSGSNKKNVYEECDKLRKLGIFKAFPIGKNQTGYLFSDNEEASYLKQFFFSALNKTGAKQKSDVEKIASTLPMTDYYISLPVSLRTTFDVFYAPNYLLTFVDKEDKEGLKRLRQLFFNKNNGNGEGRVIVKPVSLRAREFKYDKNLGASLATNEQAIADGLNYYGQIADKEVIRTLLARASDFDLDKVAELLNKKRGMTRLLAVLLVIKAVLGKLEDEEEERILEYLQKERRGDGVPLDSKFKTDLESQAIPLLLPNDEAYNNRERIFTIKTRRAVSQALKTLA